jgi:hypothetical protein
MQRWRQWQAVEAAVQRGLVEWCVDPDDPFRSRTRWCALCSKVKDRLDGFKTKMKREGRRSLFLKKKKEREREPKIAIRGTW